MIAALLLAAGAARRFGAPKLLADLHGKPVVRRSAEAIRSPSVERLIVVVRPQHDEIRRALDGLDAHFAVNPDPEAGMASSIATGVSALGAEVDAAIVVLADEPRLDAAVIEKVIQRHRTGGVAIVQPRYRGVRGHPVLFARSVFAELASLAGDAGARTVVDRDPARVCFIDVDDANPIDVDTPADLARLRQDAQYSPTSAKL